MTGIDSEHVWAPDCGRFSSGGAHGYYLYSVHIQSRLGNPPSSFRLSAHPGHFPFDQHGTRGQRLQGIGDRRSGETAQRLLSSQFCAALSLSGSVVMHVCKGASPKRPRYSFKVRQPSRDNRWSEKVNALQIPPADDVRQLIEHRMLLLCSFALNFDHRRGLQVPERMWIVTGHLPSPAALTPQAPRIPAAARTGNSGWTSSANGRFLSSLIR